MNKRPSTGPMPVDRTRETQKRSQTMLTEYFEGKQPIKLKVVQMLAHNMNFKTVRNRLQEWVKVCSV